MLVKRWRALTLAAVSTLLVALLLPILVRAQTANDSVSLGISPQVLDLTANPGEKLTNSFRLTNASDESVDIKAIPENFTPRGEEGAVDLTTDATTYSLAQWISVTPETVTLGSKKTQDFKVSISVPDTAEPGSHFGSVVFKTIPPEQKGSGALISQEIAPVILLRVAGNVTESAQVASFTTAKSFYSIDDSVEFLSRIENTGSVHFKPTGKITVKDMFGHEISTLELDKKNVLPSSIRQIPTTWNSSGFKFGRYTATLTLVFGENNEIRTVTHSFYFFPYQIILPILFVLLLLVYVIVKYQTRIRKALKVLSGKDAEK